MINKQLTRDQLMEYPKFRKLTIIVDNDYEKLLNYIDDTLIEMLGLILKKMYEQNKKSELLEILDLILDKYSI